MPFANSITARASMLERSGPAIALIITAASGIVGALELRGAFELLHSTSSPGQGFLFAQAARVETRVGTILAAAAVVGLFSASFSLVRLFRKNAKPSPPGWPLIPTAAVAFTPPLLVALALWLIVKEVAVHDIEGVVNVGDSVGRLCVAAIGVAMFSFIVSTALVFAPIKSKSGPRAAPFILTIAIEFITIAMAALYFWAAYLSISLVRSGILT